ncbi:S-adenosyl-L-methionine-dependent methyltransferase superfamily protein [Zea mays]|uniref:S-adenosyl-L-methionine-dependent methyltransferase superfamily protein n=1 Tax=Zea mays TaxID=4577 RepID=A0A1D6LW08_MAIZE|nr:S-adenosyl-L-methionine-dependent methyltransferase superfamily protein [Zea mays]
MSLCCCCSTATGRGVLLPSLLLGRRHWTGHHLLNLRATTTVVSSSSAAATSSLSPPQQRQITVYVDTLLEWNQRMNLTAVTDEAEVMARHVADSLAMLPPLERWKFTLLESMRKRCTFLEHAVEAMNLSNVDVVCDRAEKNLSGQKVGQSLDFRESYDIVAARAVAELKVLAEYCIPLVRIGGLFIAAKGHDPHEEVRNAEGAIKKLGASMLELCNVESMGPHGQRTAVLYVKERATPKKYPRLPGTPSKAPL